MGTHVGGLIRCAVFVVVQAYPRAVAAKKLEDMLPMSVHVGVVGVALRLEDAKAHADYAHADDALSETRRGRSQQLLPVVVWIVCHVLVWDACGNACRAQLVLPSAGGCATQTYGRLELPEVWHTESNFPSRLSSGT